MELLKQRLEEFNPTNETIHQTLDNKEKKDDSLFLKEANPTKETIQQISDNIQKEEESF